ncbi:MerR family transcriptional regulator [Celeribacter indicus]|uniref:MerR family transcriptional regulator n=1 Tax=Celeribacter indicus TaxID=1208324 RepID=A0A0B5E5H7_9RHOB|nr:MerR family transcriptional regulator [Celeribacter indicus]AJE47597.1 MerR family transcriptional regulator [Celeribacter indicus]SDW11411.1 Cu(I)-responsive transcriptional regulator [Celeribacter indicus]
MNIGKASEETGLPVKTIRYYEEIGLVAPERAGNGYRDFGPAELARLRLLAQARLMGFSLEECRSLIALEGDPARHSRDVRALAEQNLAAVRARISALEGLEARLSQLIERCHGDDTPDCAILDGLTHRTPTN